MTYEYITGWTSPNQSPRYQNIKYITIHWWGDPSTRPGFNGVCNWLCTPAAQVSAHYVVEAGRVACLVDCNKAAWHAGSAAGNQTSIGIECNPRMSAGDLETVAELVADLRKTYGDLPLVPHSHWVGTACPGTYHNKLGWIDGRARQLARKTTTTTTAATSAAVNDPRVEELLQGGNEMHLIELPNYGTGTYKKGTESLYALFGPQFFLRFTGGSAARGFAKQCGGAPVVVSAAFWDHCAAAAMHTSNNDGYKGDLHTLAKAMTAPVCADDEAK